MNKFRLIKNKVIKRLIIALVILSCSINVFANCPTESNSSEIKMITTEQLDLRANELSEKTFQDGYVLFSYEVGEHRRCISFGNFDSEINTIIVSGEDGECRVEKYKTPDSAIYFVKKLYLEILESLEKVLPDSCTILPKQGSTKNNVSVYFNDQVNNRKYVYKNGIFTLNFDRTDSMQSLYVISFDIMLKLLNNDPFETK